MATIIFNSENIADIYAPSLNAAFQQILDESGVYPRVVAPYGAWSSPAIDAAYGIKGRGPASDHYKGRAVDIANYQAIASKIGLTRLKAIMAAHGWGNIQINGDDFSIEPWHYANHSTSPAPGYGVTALTTPTALTPIEENNVNGVIYYAGQNKLGSALDSDNAKRTDPITVTLPTGGTHAVGPLSMYFQAYPGGPLVAFTGGKEYSATVGGLEYKAFSAAQKPWNDDYSDARLLVRIDQLAELVKLRGLAA